MSNDSQNPSAGGDRAPSEADRPPVSRVGDELLERSDEAADTDDEQIEREAYEAAQQKGWDKNVKDV